ncbi:hypothetical protein [Bacillus altitudinis]|uniref:hypothetical protein n=1 Tax=Bacillus altitudinis TaxID=293387 RepID=UPI003CF7756C
MSKVHYGDRDLLEEIINPIYRAQKKYGIIKNYQEWLNQRERFRKKIIMKEKDTQNKFHCYGS